MVVLKSKMFLHICKVTLLVGSRLTYFFNLRELDNFFLAGVSLLMYFRVLLTLVYVLVCTFIFQKDANCYIAGCLSFDVLPSRFQ